jgi:adenosylhomocysteine nucleosidase
MAERKWLILTALAIEAKAIAAEFGPLITEGQMHTLGIRAKHIDRNRVSASAGIILAGIAGALDPELNIGDTVLDARIEGPWDKLGIRCGEICTSDHLIASVAEKKSLFASSKCPVVDMEGAIVREIADGEGIPFLHIRAVSDRADEALPERMATWIDDFGEPKMSKVSADLMFRPQLVPVLMRLQKNSAVAVKSAADAVRRILEAVAR